MMLFCTSRHPGPSWILLSGEIYFNVQSHQWVFFFSWVFSPVLLETTKENGLAPFLELHFIFREHLPWCLAGWIEHISFNQIASVSIHNFRVPQAGTPSCTCHKPMQSPPAMWKTPAITYQNISSEHMTLTQMAKLAVLAINLQQSVGRCKSAIIMTVSSTLYLFSLFLRK